MLFDFPVFYEELLIHFVYLQIKGFEWAGQKVISLYLNTVLIKVNFNVVLKNITEKTDLN